MYNAIPAPRLFFIRQLLIIGDALKQHIPVLEFVIVKPVNVPLDSSPPGNVTVASFPFPSIIVACTTEISLGSIELIIKFLPLKFIFS